MLPITRNVVLHILIKHTAGTPAGSITASILMMCLSGGRILPLGDAPSDLAPIRGTDPTVNTSRVYSVSAPTSPWYDSI
jgi:hypothetical protein